MKKEINKLEGYYLISVGGNIIATDKKHYAQNWVCGGCSAPLDNINLKICSVRDNLVLNDKKRAVPYAIYYAANSVSISNEGDLKAAPGYMAAYCYYKDAMYSITSKLKVEVPAIIEQSTYRGLFMDVFSILELFLSDLILCLIYSDIETFKKAKVFFQSKKKRIADLEIEMHNFFFKGVIYHRFRDVRDIYKEIVGIDIPDYCKLGRFLEIRNNIVHRYSFSNKDRMTVDVVSTSNIKELIKTSDVFVFDLIGKIKHLYP